MNGLKWVFRSKKNIPSPTPTSSSSVQAPVPEDDSQHDPPPYSASSTTQPEQNITPDAAPPQDNQPQGLLDPNLNFTAAQMEQEWRAKDKMFARAIVQFVAERFDGNLKGWAGYRYTYINENENPPKKESAWDDLLGYNAWAYRGRFKQVSSLAKRDFERRGFEVKKCEVYTSQDGIYVQWSLDLKKNFK